MDFVIKYIRCLWLAVFLGVVTTACDSESDLTTPTEEEKLLSIGFKVPTRSSFEYEDGTGYENYIDWTDYRIYFFDADNKLIAPFTPDENGIVTRAGEGDDAVEYEAVGKIPEELIEGTNRLKAFKIVVLANWPESAYPVDDNLTTETTIDDICDATAATFDCLTDFELDEDHLIPFYGVQEYSDITLTGETTELESSVELLRAMAKVEVILDTSIPDSDSDKWADLDFADVKIHRYNAKGYCAPTGVYTRDDYPDDKDEPTLHLVDGANDADNADKSLSFHHVTTGTEDKWVAYLPEYSNQGENDFSYIELKFNYQLDSDTDSYKIYFASYEETTPTKSNIDLIRNNVYRFTVSKGGFKLLLKVSDWQGLYENTFDFGNGQIVSPVAPWDDEINNDIEF